jgi:S-adenosylmethionine hydrolase
VAGPLRRGSSNPPPVITLLTDYGSGSLYVGLLHGVIARIAPAATVIDLSHEVPAGDVLAGALALADALPYLPVGIHVAVVDPGVGSGRRALALRCGDGRVLVGPDNGLLTLGVRAAGGPVSAVDISASALALQPLSSTFHGRDIFAPVAAALAAGRTLAQAGAAIADPVALTEPELPPVELRADALEATVSGIDAYGNLSLLAMPADAGAANLRLGHPVAVTVGGHRVVARYASTFSDVGAGRLLLHEDSNGRLALAVHGGSAAELLGVRPGVRLWLGA